MDPDYADKSAIVFADDYPIKVDLPPFAFKNEIRKQHMEEEKTLWGRPKPPRKLKSYELKYPFDRNSNNPEEEEDDAIDADEQVTGARDTADMGDENMEPAEDMPQKAPERAIELSEEESNLPPPPQFKK